MLNIKTENINKSNKLSVNRFIVGDFIPAFKQNKTEQFYFNDNEWIKCNKTKINLLYQNWVCSKRAERYTDDDGFLVFGYDTKEKPITICYKFSEGIDILKRTLIIGKEYLFSDMLQEEKAFKVEWKKGILSKIESHPNAANCFVSGSQYFLYVKELGS